MTHIMFCCNQSCRDAKIMDMRRNIGAIVSTTTHMVTDSHGRVTRFIVGKTIDFERIRGLPFDSWSTCGNVSYGKEEMEYLDLRIGRK